MRRRLVGVCACWAMLLGCLDVFAAGRPSSTEYVTDGLVAHWDAIDNTLVGGVRSHDPAATTWCDLTGNGSDVTLPSFVTVEANAMFSAANLNKKPDTDTTAAVTYPTLAALNGLAVGPDAPPFTVEVVAQRGRWIHTDNYYNLQTIFGTPRGSVGYRNYNAANGFFFLSFPKSTSELGLMDWHAGKDPIELHTASVVWGSDMATGCAWIDAGSAVAFQDNTNLPLTPPNYFSMFSNVRADVRIHAIRVYSRELTDAERAQNHELDRARFTSFKVKPMLDQIHTGTAVEPDPIVVNPLTGERLVNGTDYAVTYANNELPGTATVNVTGIGDYWAGSSATLTFRIILPETYREIDYIESSGTQYIDTGYLPNPTTRMEASLMFVGASADRTATQPGAAFWGCAEAGATFSVNFGALNDQDDHVFTWLDKAYADGATAYILNIKGLRSARRTFTVDAATGKTTYGTATLNAAKKKTNHMKYALCLFGSRGADGTVKPFTYYKMRVYGWKIWDGDVLRHDFVPCYRVFDHRVGLLDKVSGRFHENAGKGTFSYSTSKYKEMVRASLPADYHPLDYLLATGAQHIATGVMAASDVTVMAEFMPTSNETGQRVFGAREKTSDAMTADDLFFEVYLNGEKKWACCCSNGPQGGNGTDGMWSIGTAATGVMTNQSFTLDSWGNAFYVNGVKQIALSRDRSARGTEITLLKAHNSVQGHGQLRSACIWKAGVLVRRLVPCYRVSDGLTGMYDLVEENFHPSAGQHPLLHGTGGEVGTPWFGGSAKGSMGFHAGKRYDSLTSFSFAMWVRNPRAGSFGLDDYTYGGIVGQGALGGCPGFCCYLSRKGAEPQNLRVQLRDANGRTCTLSLPKPEVLLDDQWHHLAFTFDSNAGEAYLYLDGKAVASITSAADIFYSPAVAQSFFSIGAHNENQWNNYPYLGHLSQVSLWNRPLTAGEVDRLRIHPVTGSETGLLGAWPLSSGSAGLVDIVSQQSLTLSAGDLGFVLDDVKWYVPGMMFIVR